MLLIMSYEILDLPVSLLEQSHFIPTVEIQHRYKKCIMYTAL